MIKMSKQPTGSKKFKKRIKMRVYGYIHDMIEGGEERVAQRVADDFELLMFEKNQQINQLERKLNDYKMPILKKQNQIKITKYKNFRYINIPIKGCPICKEKKTLNAHHIIPKRILNRKGILGELRIKICKDCHKKLHPENRLIEEINNFLGWLVGKEPTIVEFEEFQRMNHIIPTINNKKKKIEFERRR